MINESAKIVSGANSRAISEYQLKQGLRKYEYRCGKQSLILKAIYLRIFGYSFNGVSAWTFLNFAVRDI